MNKNLLTYTPMTEWSEIVVPAFENAEELKDWVIYELRELHRIVVYHLHHGVKPREFREYVNKSHQLIREEMVNSLLAFRGSFKAVVPMVNAYLDEIAPDFARINEM